MDPVTLVVAALLAGAGAGVTTMASSAVIDAYAGLKNLVRGRVTLRRPGAEAVMDRDHAAPAAWEGELMAVLTAADVGRDEQVVAAAQRLLALIDPTGAAIGKYAVDVRGTRGVQIGDHNVQHNEFS